MAMPHAGSLLRTALRLTREKSLSEDLVQEVLLRAWRSFEQFEAGTNCKAWLFKIMLNLASKRRKQIQTRPQLLSLEENESFKLPVAVTRTPEFTGSEVVTALDSLPEEHRTVLLLGVVEGFTCKEIGQMLSIPIGTVMSRLSRARVGLRRKLTEPVGQACVCKPEVSVKQAQKGAYELL
jgi:RNA polymerase sigma-70 factor (ECF subfamily)